ncbi:exonuclease RecJ [Robiginitalea myxolifaciens]|uniref:Single-stranded-DNA-specific exonuclease RecJ n=1 Tax=Robiginitalea myxolifaciens TaxID=400055 RepID=A0A1I6G4M0_9FLAO|nr:single-stranded-DNA-specific exonuclease RecJ [Robiginitalea myxolifaciens]SFR37163.1 exonuclease RecJ [Robiginitalea myxolifaciens]
MATLSDAGNIDYRSQTETRWTFKTPPDQASSENLAAALGVSPSIAGLLVQRGITSFEEARLFFRPQWEHLHDPFLMKDMETAVTRIQEALNAGERILVYGDYDVDGTTSVALMTTFLRARDAEVAYYIPDRYKEGYGLSMSGIDFAEDNGFTLIIALDCGIKALEQSAYASAKAIDLIICDHHRPGPELPLADAILNPKREDCKYPYKELCGCGVGFKLIQALQRHMGLPETLLYPYLDLVAVAIGADIVPITGENRILAKLGLEVVNNNPRPGIAALLDDQRAGNLGISDLVFRIAPRINAAGRMEHGELAVDLLIEANPNRARQLAQGIEQLNTERREADGRITDEALAQIQATGAREHTTTVVFNPDWHKGVIGIVASRLMETYYRPTLVFTKSGDKLAASARSVRGFDIYQALEQCSDYLEQFGGHTYAAGLTLHPDQYEGFKAHFETVVSRSISPELLHPEVQIDAVLPLEAISPKLLRILDQFAPFGPGNPRPVFFTAGLRDTGYAQTVGADGNHLKFQVTTESGQPRYGAIGFGQGEALPIVRGAVPFELAYSLEENRWNGRSEIQLKVKGIRNTPAT